MPADTQISRRDLARINEATLRQQEKDSARDENRSGYGSIPGDEFPPIVYRSIIIAFAWMMAAAWLAFGSSATDLDLAIATVLGIVFLALPIVLYRTTCTACDRQQGPRAVRNQRLSSPVDTATGTLSGREACLQVLLIPVALALAATVIGGAYAFVG